MGKLKKFLISIFVIVINFLILSNEVNADVFLEHTINNYHWGYYLAIILVTIVVIALSVIALLMIGKKNSNPKNQNNDEEKENNGSV